MQADRLEDLVTPSAYQQAREKLDPKIFIELLRILSEGFYQSDPQDPGLQWCSHRLLGFDPTTLNLPDTPATRAHYDVQRNQHAECVQAQSGMLYDLLNELPLGATLGKRRSGKQQLMELEALLQENDVVVCDREFGDYGLLSWLSSRKRHYIVRLQSQSFAAVQAFAKGTEREAIVEVSCPRKQREFVAQHALPQRMLLRVLKVLLPSGEEEILATSLCDSTLYSPADLAEAYRLRWGIETCFDRLKNIFELERFSGGSLQRIEQDFYGTLFLCGLEAMLIEQTQQELRESSPGCKHQKKVNRAVSYSALVDQAIEILLHPQEETEQTLQRLRTLLRCSPTLVRSGRKNKRVRRSAPNKVRYLKYKRRPPA